MMGAALTEARVPVSDDVQTALADAGFKPDEPGAAGGDAGACCAASWTSWRGMVSSPFEVIEALQNSARDDAGDAARLHGDRTGAVAAPGAARCGAADAAGRRFQRSGVTRPQALEQTAQPDTLSPDALRRAITVRNWIPAGGPAGAGQRDPQGPARRGGDRRMARRRAPRSGISCLDDRWIRRAEHPGGRAARARRACSRGVLLRHGTGVVDAWAEQDLPRGKINRLLREAQIGGHLRPGATSRYVDAMVQHAIGTAVEHGQCPRRGAAGHRRTARRRGLEGSPARHRGRGRPAVERIAGPADRTPEGDRSRVRARADLDGEGPDHRLVVRGRAEGAATPWQRCRAPTRPA